jgi:hypothetical protein
MVGFPFIFLFWKCLMVLVVTTVVRVESAYWVLMIQRNFSVASAEMVAGLADS